MINEDVRLQEQQDKAKVCPICHSRNDCEGSHACWCAGELFPSGIFELVPVELRGKACICIDCLNEFMMANGEKRRNK
ncbi:cysteine-rich CWC family protein [Paenibacillus silvisoli]|uniref:cysteine-rich CWC family protein n=1 Tax=Paenibacillus silvisoli TaxID=3110539 RepID=UPI00280506B4|nr:cysteine-rich CWC family protein [Paenibacillus silvisoli]